jgi:hypothetical protein
VLLTAYYPFCDERVLFPERKDLVRNWFVQLLVEDDDDDNKKGPFHPFFKNLGLITETQQDERGWIRENRVGHIGRSIFVCCAELPALAEAKCSLAFKRFFFDGFFSGYFSVGIKIDEQQAAAILADGTLLPFIQSMADVPVRSPHRPGEPFTLSTFGRLASDLYATGSVRKVRSPDRAKAADGLRRGRPMLVISAIASPDQIAVSLENATNFKLKIPIEERTGDYKCLGGYLNWKEQKTFALVICSSERSEAATSRFLRAGIAHLYRETFGLERMIAVLQGNTFDKCDEEGKNVIGTAVNRALVRLQGKHKPDIASDKQSYDLLIEAFSRLYRPGRVDDLENIIERLRARPNLQRALSQSHLASTVVNNIAGDLVMGNKQTGGVSITGGTFSGNEIVGGNKTETVQGDKTVTVNVQLQQQIQQALQPVAAAIEKAPPEKQAEAAKTLDKIKEEVAKDKKADDGTLAKLVEGLVGLVPSAVTAVASAFGTPLLGGIAGPITKYVLDKFKPSAPAPDNSGSGAP